MQERNTFFLQLRRQVKKMYYNMVYIPGGL